MQDTTKNAMFELFKAQNEQAKSKELKEVKPVILPPIKAEELKKVDPIKEAKGVKMEFIEIIWHEGRQTPDYTGAKFTRWDEAQKAFFELWEANEKGETGGYTKVKTNIKFVGVEAVQVCRIDLTAKEGNGDFNPTFETLQSYLSTQFLEPHEYFIGDTMKVETDEISSLTFNDLITPIETPIIEEISNFIEAVKPTEETEQKPRIFISNYSKYSIAITGETKQIKDVLKDLGGVYNRYLKCGAGWIFAKRKENEILEELKLYANF